MYLGTNYLPPVIHPTQQLVNHTFSTTVVPHIHPTHATTVNHHMYQHKHYCPQTASCCNEVCNQEFNCCNPCAMPMPGAPYGGPMGPGYQPGPMGPMGPMGPRPF
jgi:spore coat protein D